MIIAALALMALALVAIDYSLTAYAEQLLGAPVEAQVRYRVLAISLGAALLAMGGGLLVARSLSRRVRTLKALADGLLDVTERPVEFEPGDDLGALERSLSAVANQLRTQVENLRLEAARREAILSGMAEGVLAVDPDLRVIFCNQTLLRAIGFRGAQFEGFSLLELVREPALTALVRSVLATGEHATLRFKFSADTPRTFEVQVTPLAMASGRGAIAIFHDITDLERLEQVRKDFVANVSHELRTPLSGIIGYADTLLDGALDDVANRTRFVEIIRANAVRLGSIAADLLTLSELESGLDQGETESISMRGVLDGVLLTVESEARERGVRLNREEFGDVRVAGSRLRLEQALLNLLANAIKFNRPGGEVRLRVDREPDGRACITVADTGVGIPSEDLPRIFERFYRADKARSRQVGGTGLGLSIVKHVVERMNGTITVESQLGKGTTFRILLS